MILKYMKMKITGWCFADDKSKEKKRHKSYYFISESGGAYRNGAPFSFNDINSCNIEKISKTTGFSCDFINDMLFQCISS